MLSKVRLGFLLALTLALVVSIPTPTAARSSRGRYITGIVQKTNAWGREAQIMRTDIGTRLGFIWIGRTIFVRNGRLVNAAFIEPGATVKIIYHQPFFGRPFVTKVTLLSALDRAP